MSRVWSIQFPSDQEVDIDCAKLEEHGIQGLTLETKRHTKDTLPESTTHEVVHRWFKLTSYDYVYVHYGYVAFTEKLGSPEVKKKLMDFWSLEMIPAIYMERQPMFKAKVFSMQKGVRTHGRFGRLATRRPRTPITSIPE